MISTISMRHLRTILQEGFIAMNDNNLSRYLHIINGEAVEPSSGKFDNVYNPATGEVVGTYAQGNEADVDLAVAAAKAALKNPQWKNSTPEQRSAMLHQCAQVVLENASELAYLEITSSGATINRMKNLDIPFVADVFMTMAEEVKKYPFSEHAALRPFPEMVHTQVIKQPVGVCGMITAWNFPLLLFTWKVAAALAAGNTMVVKAAETTPTSTARLVELLQAVLPKGVLNVVSGRGSVVGEALSLHPDVNKISFTGSTNIGRHIQQNCSQTFKRCTLELGGKGPGIVMPDADLDMVASGALFGVFINSGQACESGTRLLVHESIHDELVDVLVKKASHLVLGNPLDPQTGMGPMSTESHGNSVLKYIESAREEGATIVCGGKRAEVKGCEGGFFVEPTIIANATNEMKVSQEEIFGPVLTVIKYSTPEEAIEIANDNIYGLSAGIWCKDLVAAQEMAKELQAGSIWINDWHMLRSDAPFGGYKQSGYGRELSHMGIDAYVETKAITTSFETNVAQKGLHRIVHTQNAQ